MKKIKKFKSEKGQALVELALILPILLVICITPIDFVLYTSTKTNLESVASECVRNMDYATIDGKNEETMKGVVRAFISNKFPGEFNVEEIDVRVSKSAEEIHDYMYHVYSSEFSSATDFAGQFDNRLSNFRVQNVSLQLTYKFTPVTPWGRKYFGPSPTVSTPVYQKSIYAGGFVP